MSNNNSKFDQLSPEDQHLYQIRHTAEHVLTQAMINLYGPDKIIMAMGPATEDGFYFDFDSPQDFKLSESDFPVIEKEMQRLIDLDLKLESITVSADQARDLFKDNPYKQDWITQAESNQLPITLYYTGKGTENEFVDLCAGPHADSTGQIGAFKLLSLAGAYWHGDSNNKMLSRVYGTAFSSHEELEEFIKNRQEAEKRDHRKLGPKFDLFTFSDLIGPGFPLYTPKGCLLRQLINGYVEKLQSQQDYQQVWTPQVAKAELFETSGHYDKYKDDMFTIHSHYSDDELFLKPMNCPQHTQIFASKPRSYRDLPIRYTDFAMLYRDEKPGELSGLARVRAFSQDDCHVFCSEEQVDDEVDVMLSMTKEVMRTFGLKYRYRLSTRDPNTPEKYLGDPKIWDKVEKWAVKIMERNHIEYYDGVGEAAFYAPKMDLMATDALGREWQLSTVQIDYVQPQRFGLKYTAADGSDQTPIMVHRAIIGSFERFLMILIEHFAGAFPVWLSPVQVAVLPVSDKSNDYAQEVFYELKNNGIRVELDQSDQSLGKKIRNAEDQKYPYMVIVGEKEAKDSTISVRQRGEQDLGSMDLTHFLSLLKEKIESKALNW